MASTEKEVVESGLMFKLLDAACGNPTDDPKVTQYAIELHCVLFKVHAYKEDGKWSIVKWTAEDC